MKLRMCWFFVVMFLSLTYGNIFCEARHDKKLPSAVVVGTVYCDTCFQQDFSMGSHFISGASVEVECTDGSSNPRFKKEVKTNEHGEFRVQLPFSVSKHVRRIKGCNVKLISSSEPYCAVASSATSSSLNLKSRKQGLHIFSAGFFTFKPLKQPNLCNQKPSIQNTNFLDSMKSFFPPNIDPSFPPPLQDPTTPSVGGLLPKLPTLPPILGIQIPPLLPPDEKVVNPQNLPTFSPIPFFPPPIVPNPLQPPPLVPNPLQPPPLVPNPLQPPSSPIIPNPFQPPSPTPLFPNPFQPPPSPPPSSPLFPFPPLFPSPGTPPSSTTTKNGSP
ncbi:unnamed protein product [Lupinus luteus]|uniref:Uncharacterized protein n=1 Tax=Lupinus luteus TaxID=3873 RepID=A0AAV1XAW5_LUPLU